MRVVAHNIVSSLLSLALLVALYRISSRQTSSGGVGPLAAFGALIVLVVIGLISAFGNGGDVFGMAQLLAWTTFLHVPLFLVCAGVIQMRQWPKLALAHWATVIVLGLIVLDASVIEPHWLQVSRLTIHSARLTESVRVVILADIQTDQPGRYEARVLRAAMEQDPDLILFLGDYVQLGRRSGSYEVEIETLRALLDEAHLQAPLGAYAITGNVDLPGGWVQAFNGLPVTTMEATTSRDLGPVMLTGLSLWDSYDQDKRVERHDAFHIVIGHSPNFSLGSVEADLLIAGHTHGGQVRLPLIGPLLTLSSVPRSWAAGVTTIAPGRTLIVSRGIGMERANAPRLRLLCRPELVVIDLVPAGRESE
ncbi:MAG: metallophosphoesterase [Anaerolineae bacterium]|jgi:hypothetical protein|nr:metallophosphoesterase [Anaerolineae bacterium]